MKTSVYSGNQQKEDKSRLFFHDFILHQGWKCRDTSSDNDIDQDIELFERDEQTLKLHSTAKFLKIQLKSTEHLNYDGAFVKYDCSVKFLHFCDICDTPAILVLYSLHENLAYCLFVQEYIYTFLDKENPNWRTRKETVTIKIPLPNLIKDRKSGFDFKNIFRDGITTITQLRKVKEVQRYYQLLKLQDISHGLARRSLARILIDASFAESKTAMRAIIPKINEEIKVNNYYKNKITARFFKKKNCDVVCLSFYNNINQFHHGQPFCETQWINDKLDVNFRPLTMNCDETISDILIKWNNVDFYDDLVVNNTMSKGDYLQKIELIYSDFKKLYEQIAVIHQKYQNQEISFKDYKNQLKRFSQKLEKLYNTTTKMGFAPIECTDMDRKLIGAVSYLHDIKIIVEDKNRDENNIYICVDGRLEGAAKDIIKYQFEREKID